MVRAGDPHAARDVLQTTIITSCFLRPILLNTCLSAFVAFLLYSHEDKGDRMKFNLTEALE